MKNDETQNEIQTCDFCGKKNSHVCRDRKIYFHNFDAKKKSLISSHSYLQTNDFILQVAINYSSFDRKHMQRCPYLHEMKERLLGAQRGDTMAMESFDRERDNLLENTSRPGSNRQSDQVGKVATVVKVRLSSLETPQVIQVISKFF